ncbi:major facilitator superfamily transporter [Tritrichomonas foetus]|uniref:Major facilitator superfamily transporter n=1 Tax=Tritrichomonas foetus TaxID=1144522 RepID=A0A1J4JUU5_9EUKA|nr:major facilitator superfamily transporter [Tritrichomonas foetus]|eukprot:OHT01029.1 major facilitator superfamily transporter [Tritrichomonas foetus]
MVICSKQLPSVCILLMGSVTFGFSCQFPALCLASMQGEFTNFDWENEKFITKCFTVVSALTSIVGSVFFLFLFLRFQRKLIISIMSVAYSIFWFIILATSESHIWIAILSIGLQGFIIGGYCVVIPPYIVELSPATAVNFYGTLHQVGCALAIVIFDVVGAFADWRVYTYIGASWVLIFGGLIWLVPDDEHSLKLKKRTKVFEETLFQKKYAFKIVTVLALMIFQQICGINAILNNMAALMASSGLDINSNLQQAISTSAQLIAVIIGCFIVDPLGKKVIWAFSSFGISFCLLIYALNLKFDFGYWLPTLCIFVYMLFFGLAVGPIPWYITSTLFPSGIDLITQTMVTVVNMGFSFAVVFLYPFLKDNIGEFGTMLIFMSVTIIAGFFGLFAIPKEDDQDIEGISLL